LRPCHSIACARICEHVFFSDADELEWYIPAGIELSDLQRSLTVIEQFEKSPLDLNGKRASQLLHKKRRRRRRRRQASSSDSEGAGSSDEDAPRKKARKTREQETYKSAQFIEDSDEEYGRDIDAFFTREAELRKRTALTAAAAAAAAADGHQPQRLGTMRATGTKKRRRPQASRGTSSAKGRAAKRRALLSSSGTPGKNGEGEDGGINAVTPHRSPSPTASFGDDDHGAAHDDGDEDEDGGGGSGGVSGGIDVGGDSGGSGDEDDDEGDAGQSSIVDRDVAGHRHPDSPQSPKSGRPKARPLYRRHAPLRATPAADATPDTRAAGTDDEEDDHDDNAGHDPSPTVPSLRVADEDESTGRAKGGGSGGGGGGGVSGGLRKGRLIISDEED